MAGTLYGLGLGPGDPELMTVKAVRILKSVPVIAWPAPDTGPSFARSIAEPHLPGGQIEIPIVVPMRTERFPAKDVYDKAAMEIAAHLDAGRDVAVLCEGDPFFYGSFMYVFERLSGRYRTEIVPGVSSIMAAASAAGRPLAARNDILTVLPGPLPDTDLEAAIEAAGAVAIIKIGRHFSRLRDLLQKMNLLSHAIYVERVTLAEGRIMPLSDVPGNVAPYFSIILIYKGGEGWAAKAAATVQGADSA